MPEIKNNELVFEIRNEKANLNENKSNNQENEFSEDAFYATGHFSIHHQPNEDGDVFMGE